MGVKTKVTSAVLDEPPVNTTNAPQPGDTMAPGAATDEAVGFATDALKAVSDSSVESKKEAAQAALAMLRTSWATLMHDVGQTAHHGREFASNELNLAYQHLLVAENLVIKHLETKETA